MSERPAGGIYDLGYQNYTGERLGRWAAVNALYRESLRGTFGLGRGVTAKIAPAFLIGIALSPALVQVVIGALSNDAEELIEHSEYFNVVQFLLALYCAAVAPDIAGRDQRNRSLALYFSRAISRTDYALAKYGAMVTAMLAITLVPQALLYFGNALAADDFVGYFTDEAGQIGPILVAALLVSALIGAVAVAIASQTPRRSFATFGIIVAFVLSFLISGLLVDEIDTQGTHYAVFAAPFNVVQGMTAWIFGVSAPEDSVVITANFDGSWYLLAALIWIAGGVAILIRRYRTVVA